MMVRVREGQVQHLRVHKFIAYHVPSSAPPRQPTTQLSLLRGRHATLWQGSVEDNQELYKGILRYTGQSPRCYFQ